MLKVLEINSMNNPSTRRALFTSLLLALPVVGTLLFYSLQTTLAASVAASQREHLTAAEIELVRDTQELDKRTQVFVKAVERRMLVMTDPAAAAKQAQKDVELWGELPQGTRTQLFSDIGRILDEAITNIDDAAERSPQSTLLAKSLRILAEASQSLLPRLIAKRDAASTEAERDALEQAIENAQTVIEAAKKLPPEEKKK
ncbi:MAG: hypothetical protein M3458_16965 [Acidobacteriota bacterium]|nr:hypothetical protein [Acidobacteriota bacterium]